MNAPMNPPGHASANDAMTWAILIAVVGAVALSLVGCGGDSGAEIVPPAAATKAATVVEAAELPDVRFVEVADEAGIDFVHHNAATGEKLLPETMGSGVAVLDDMILVSYVRQLRSRGLALDEAVTQAAVTRLRPVLMTTLVASLGFLPMAFSTGMGAEVQRPLATVVIGGVIGSMVMSLLVLRVLYVMFKPPGQARVHQAKPQEERQLVEVGSI